MITEWILNQQNLITFVLVDATNTEVTGLGNTFTLEISKAGAAFAASAGTKSEIANGWYAYLATAGEADTIGPVSIRVTGAGVVQQNLEYSVAQRTPGARSFTYTITDSVTTLPLEGVTVWITTDVAGQNIIWAGTTDTFGVARDANAGLPYLDDGTYYFWSRRSGYSFSNPDTEVVSASSTTGDTTGTPLATGGSGSGPTFAQPLQRTLLPLPTYAAIMGLNPPHFAGGFGQTVFPVGPNCDDVWPRYPWQAADRISLSELADTIYNVEEEIANYLGYYPAPKWIAKEMHQYPQHYRRDVFGLGSNGRGMYKSVITKKGKFIQAGQRAVSLLDDDVVVVYSDESGSGINDTATITVATTLTDECEINVYFAGTGGASEWEIRPPRSKTISGGNIIFVFDSWLLLSPDLLAAYPTTAGFDGLDLSTAANFVSTVDVYREYTDTTEKSAEFSWEPKPLNALLNTVCTSCGGTGCAACANTTQDGCLHIRGVDRGIAVPTPATYDEDEESWSLAQWSECREPDTVKVWYYAGDLDERFLRGDSCERLSKYYAQAIAWMASARLERPPCGCQNIRAMFNDLRRDLAFSGTGEGEGSYFISPGDLNNPFGTRKGELLAWRKLGKLTERVPDFAVV